jgi:hypothetical protein
LYNQLLAIAAKHLNINVFVTYSHEILGVNKVILLNYFTRKPIILNRIPTGIDLNREKHELQKYFTESYGLNNSAIAKEFLDLKRNKLKHIFVILKYLCGFLFSFFFIGKPKGSLNTLGTVIPQTHYHEFYVRKKLYLVGYSRLDTKTTIKKCN